MEVIAVPTAAAHLGCCAAAAPSLLPSACTEKERVDEIRKTSGGEKRVHAPAYYLPDAAHRKNKCRERSGELDILDESPPQLLKLWRERAEENKGRTVCDYGPIIFCISPFKRLTPIILIFYVGRLRQPT
jgi:hypothetical protein